MFETESPQSPPAAGGEHRVEPLITPRAFRCQCGRPIFFRNSHCLACNTPLGYEPHAAKLWPLAPGPIVNTWVPYPTADDTPKEAEAKAPTNAPAPMYARCANFEVAACNWLVDAEPDGSVVKPLCMACRLNRVIPDMTIQQNQVLWRRIEVAKRRLVSSLVALGLPVKSKVTEDPLQGVAFDFLDPVTGGAPVMTGHDEGQITLNIEEADDAKREAIRHQMHEPYRTLLGHLRHEIGHYYWDRIVKDTPWHQPFKSVFGDESVDYGMALQQHYQNGAAPDWPQRFVSAYASSHPWEDWAETWAHYLHMLDTLDTAFSFGLNAENVDMEYEAFTKEELFEKEDPAGESFLAFMNGWIRLTGVVNELSRSMGEPDFYPFILSKAAVRKLHFVHLVVKHSRVEPDERKPAVAVAGQAVTPAAPAPAPADPNAPKSGAGTVPQVAVSAPAAQPAAPVESAPDVPPVVSSPAPAPLAS
ncbi:putative zinc-binding metallopeptidase [soil metagenome]